MNPYQPPRSEIVADSPAPRPVSVVILQIVLALFAAVYLLGYLVGIYAAVRSGVHLRAPGTLAGGLLLRALPLIFMALTFWALARRKPLGRWLGLLSILGVLGLVVYQSLYPPQGPTLFPRFEISDSPGEKAGATLAQICAYGVIAWWFFSFGFSRKARTFFNTPG